MLYNSSERINTMKTLRYYRLLLSYLLGEKAA